ncbi:MAG: nucleotidyltransferase family protein, partial [Pyrinomonadaceae bacterium]
MANSDSGSRKGKLVARALAGSWRSVSLPSFDLSAAELDEVAPLLYGSGAAALGWCRVRNTNLKDESPAVVLQQAYRLLALQSAIHEQKLEKVFRLLRQASVEAVLAKGWAAARLYPDSALRPYGDFDLLVRPSQFKVAEEVLSSPEARDCWVDLHKHFSEVNDRSVDELFSRATSVPLGQENVRILSVEDHLALLSIHLLKHGAWRPVWLCDIG